MQLSKVSLSLKGGKTMEKTLYQKKVLLFIAITLMMWMSVLPGAYGSIFTPTPPTIDGNAIEWTSQNSTVVPVTNGFVHLMNDANNLYVLIDATADIGNDPLYYTIPPPNPNPFDAFYLTFDVNLNQAIDSNVDVNFGITNTSTLDPCIQYYISSNNWTGCNYTSGFIDCPGVWTLCEFFNGSSDL